MNKHTPGPWVAEPEYEGDPPSYVHNGDGRMIADCSSGYENDAANASLIAAVPEMLAALLLVRKLIVEAAATGFNCHDGDWAERLFASQQLTHAAVTKAAGSEAGRTADAA